MHEEMGYLEIPISDVPASGAANTHRGPTAEYGEIFHRRKISVRRENRVGEVFIQTVDAKPLAHHPWCIRLFFCEQDRTYEQVLVPGLIWSRSSRVFATSERKAVFTDSARHVAMRRYQHRNRLTRLSHFAFDFRNC